MDGKNKKILMEILKDMEDFAKMKGLDSPPIYILGGSGCIISGYNLAKFKEQFNV